MSFEFLESIIEIDDQLVLLGQYDPQMDCEYKTMLHFVFLLEFYIHLLLIINLMLFRYWK